MGLIRTKNNGFTEYSATIGFIHLADLPSLRTDFSMGSIVHVIEDGSKWILDDSFTWCLLNTGCGSGGGGLKYTVVDTLPPVDQASSNTAYLVKNGDHYDIYLKSGDTYVTIGSTQGQFDNLVTKNDLEDYVKKTNLTDGSIEDIVVAKTVSAQEFIEDGVKLEDKYLQKADLERGTINFKNINAENVYVSKNITADKVTGQEAVFDKVTANKELNLGSESRVTNPKWSIGQDGDAYFEEITVKHPDGIEINNENIHDYVKRLIKKYAGDGTSPSTPGGGGGDGIDEDELRRLLPAILGTSAYQADFEETNSTKPSFIQNKDKIWTDDKVWIGTKAQYESVKNTLPTDIYVVITDDNEEGNGTTLDSDTIQQILLTYANLADITGEEKAWIDNADEILQLILDNRRREDALEELLEGVLILNGG